MSGQKVGYVRVSTLDQKTDRQLVDENLDRVFEDKVSGKDIHRPQLIELLEYVRTGDTVVVHSMNRLARNLDDLRSLVRQITGKGACLRFVKENLTFTKDESPMSTLLLSVMGAFQNLNGFSFESVNERASNLRRRGALTKGGKRNFLMIKCLL